ncbi:hypothetical protein AMAG_10343 [Allomyces macrogynus ATCC 38327]|uniref:Cyclin N-terminal domain-containing protein n=1 Tax=Allomyces macrogynus (strain ATCC 38327) TaxID=578462 RepID=A0A0L0SU85_ALLM3|nr:hypothetical protein AMAG_10343 [Allomyces macrogynus ATCC 38327]|eukprot:KNE66082.1 hypothetical protein AMAG_10343 [Allomyces macrogynus ATCC 38327]
MMTTPSSTSAASAPSTAAAGAASTKRRRGPNGAHLVVYPATANAMASAWSATPGMAPPTPITPTAPMAAAAAMTSSARSPAANTTATPTAHGMWHDLHAVAAASLPTPTVASHTVCTASPYTLVLASTDLVPPLPAAPVAAAAHHSAAPSATMLRLHAAEERRAVDATPLRAVPGLADQRAAALGWLVEINERTDNFKYRNATLALAAQFIDRYLYAARRALAETNGLNDGQWRLLALVCLSLAAKMVEEYDDPLKTKPRSPTKCATTQDCSVDYSDDDDEAIMAMNSPAQTVDTAGALAAPQASRATTIAREKPRAHNEQWGTRLPSSVIKPLIGIVEHYMTHAMVHGEMMGALPSTMGVAALNVALEIRSFQVHGRAIGGRLSTSKALRLNYLDAAHAADVHRTMAHMLTVLPRELFFDLPMPPPAAGVATNAAALAAAPPPGSPAVPVYPSPAMSYSSSAVAAAGASAPSPAAAPAPEAVSLYPHAVASYPLAAAGGVVPDGPHGYFVQYPHAYTAPHGAPPPSKHHPLAAVAAAAAPVGGRMYPSPPYSTGSAVVPPPQQQQAPPRPAMAPAVEAMDWR